MMDKRQKYYNSQLTTAVFNPNSTDTFGFQTLSPDQIESLRYMPQHNYETKHKYRKQDEVLLLPLMKHNTEVIAGGASVVAVDNQKSCLANTGLLPVGMMLSSSNQSNKRGYRNTMVVAKTQTDDQMERLLLKETMSQENPSGAQSYCNRLFYEEFDQILSPNSNVQSVDGQKNNNNLETIQVPSLAVKNLKLEKNKNGLDSKDQTVGKQDNPQSKFLDQLKKDNKFERVKNKTTLDPSNDSTMRTLQPKMCRTMKTNNSKHFISNAVPRNRPPNFDVLLGGGILNNPEANQSFLNRSKNTLFKSTKKSPFRNTESNIKITSEMSNGRGEPLLKQTISKTDYKNLFNESENFHKQLFDNLPKKKARNNYEMMSTEHSPKTSRIQLVPSKASLSPEQIEARERYREHKHRMEEISKSPHQKIQQERLQLRLSLQAKAKERTSPLSIKYYFKDAKTRQEGEAKFEIKQSQKNKVAFRRNEFNLVSNSQLFTDSKVSLEMSPLRNISSNFNDTSNSKLMELDHLALPKVSTFRNNDNQNQLYRTVDFGGIKFSINKGKKPKVRQINNPSELEQYNNYWKQGQVLAPQSSLELAEYMKEEGADGKGPILPEYLHQHLNVQKRPTIDLKETKIGNFDFTHSLGEKRAGIVKNQLEIDLQSGL